MINPDDQKQMAEFGKAIFDVLPQNAREKLFLPVSAELGKGIGNALSILTYPINSLALTLNSKLDKKAKLLAEETMPKIENLKANGNYTESGAGFAMKAIESSKYSLESDVLRSYFSNLIANSLNDTKLDIISPNFASILGNLTEKDAFFLKKVSGEIVSEYIPITTIFLSGEKHRLYLNRNVCIWGRGYVTEESSTIATLESFGILKVLSEDALSAGEFPEFYASVEQTGLYKHAETQLSLSQYKNSFNKVSHEDGVLLITDLGKSFISTVVS